MSDETTSPWGLTYFSTDEDCPSPDVGMAVDLPGGATLYVGEITKEQYEEAGDEAAALGDDFGSWIILWSSKDSDGQVIGKATSLHDGLDMILAIRDAAFVSGVATDLPEWLMTSKDTSYFDIHLSDGVLSLPSKTKPEDLDRIAEACRILAARRRAGK